MRKSVGERLEASLRRQAVLRSVLVSMMWSGLLFFTHLSLNLVYAPAIIEAQIVNRRVTSSVVLLLISPWLHRTRPLPSL
ncbi:hypothetical protein SLE2022_138830 [Rubroshorea leprosula]